MRQLSEFGRLDFAFLRRRCKVNHHSAIEVEILDEKFEPIVNNRAPRLAVLLLIRRTKQLLIRSNRINFIRLMFFLNHVTFFSNQHGQNQKTTIRSIHGLRRREAPEGPFSSMCRAVKQTPRW